MIYIDAEKAKKLSYWNQLPEEIQKDIEIATDYGLRYTLVGDNLMDESIQYALQELGYYVYRHITSLDYEIRW